jgi:predicted anti-sigma-YlaC factor YlaD
MTTEARVDLHLAGCPSHKTFFSSAVNQYKLECLPLASFLQPSQIFAHTARVCIL